MLKAKGIFLLEARKCAVKCESQASQEARQAGEITLFGPSMKAHTSISTAESGKSVQRRTTSSASARIWSRSVASAPLRASNVTSCRTSLTAKAGCHSHVDHLRWDLKQIFDMAIAEGYLKLNPALFLFTPGKAKRPDHPVMTVPQLVSVFEALEFRERLIAELAVIGGMCPGEIFGLTWSRIAETYAEVRQRISEGLWTRRRRISRRGTRRWRMGLSRLWNNGANSVVAGILLHLFSRQKEERRSARTIFGGVTCNPRLASCRSGRAIFR